jgi:hypothetical protein
MTDEALLHHSSGRRTIAKFGFDGGSVYLAADGDIFRIRYAGLGPGRPGPYLSAFWEALASAQFIPETSPAIMFWPELYKHSEYFDHLHAFIRAPEYDYELTREHIAADYKIEFDSERCKVSGSWSDIARVPWYQDHIAHVVFEIAIGVAAGVTTQATSAALRAGFKKIAKKLRAQKHSVEEIESPEEDDWPLGGYL